MKCLTCGGKGYREEQHGLIQIGCPECKATGIVDEVLVTKEMEEGSDNALTEALGPLALTDDNYFFYWKQMLEGLTEEEIAFTENQIFPESIDARAVVIDVNKAETQGSPIEVNDDNYWQDTEEVKDDNGDRTEQPDTVTRSRNTRKPRKPKESKAKKTTRSKAD